MGDPKKKLPIVLHVPHASTVIPPDIRPQLPLDDAALERELLRMTDWFTDEIFRWPGCERRGSALDRARGG